MAADLVIAAADSARHVAATSSSEPAWWTWLVAILGSSALGAAVTAALGGLRATAASRRDGYALAVRTLIARVEYPYRVRRRVSDDSDMMAALAARGHDLQEQLAACRTWVNAENRAVGAIYKDVIADLDATVAPATRDAWSQIPITVPSEMTLGDWGPENPWTHLSRLEYAIMFRFGWRRILPSRIIRWRIDAADERRQIQPVPDRRYGDAVHPPRQQRDA